MGQDHPDADLHPEATGLAAVTVKPILLYSNRVGRKGDTIPVYRSDPVDKPQSLLDLNPRGLVPTLQYEGKLLYESSVLCEFLEEALPDHTPHLLPKDPYDRARTRIWTDYVASHIIPAYHRFLKHQGGDGLKEEQTESLNHLKEFTREMDPQGPFFPGKEFSLIDIVIAPWANRLWVFHHFKGGSGILKKGQGGDDEEV
ncbi:hypothetical protein NX059_003464 [Plenodomus lindquistii]|nr:hypothetical protein NX059_003464 [Plenodomus lindquistii]